MLFLFDLDCDGKKTFRLETKQLFLKCIPSHITYCHAVILSGYFVFIMLLYKVCKLFRKTWNQGKVLGQNHKYLRKF